VLAFIEDEKSWEIFRKVLYFSRHFPIFSQMGELFAHFEEKSGECQEEYKVFPEFSHDFSQIRYRLYITYANAPSFFSNQAKKFLASF